jgi:hypothetical protein
MAKNNEFDRLSNAWEYPTTYQQKELPARECERGSET